MFHMLRILLAVRKGHKYELKSYGFRCRIFPRLLTRNLYVEFAKNGDLDVEGHFLEIIYEIPSYLFMLHNSYAGFPAIIIKIKTKP